MNVKRLITLKVPRSSFVPLATALQTEHTEGATLHFQLESVNSSGKPVPKSINITESIESISKVLKSRKLF